MWIRCLVVIVGVLLLGGCATSFNGSVSVGNRRELVVGGMQGQPTAWICTIANASQDCREIQVVD